MDVRWVWVGMLELYYHISFRLRVTLILLSGRGVEMSRKG